MEAMGKRNFTLNYLRLYFVLNCISVSMMHYGFKKKKVLTTLEGKKQTPNFQWIEKNVELSILWTFSSHDLVPFQKTIKMSSCCGSH